MTTDFLIMNGGSIVQFWPQSDAAKEWWSDNVQEAPTLGQSFCVEHRYAHDIIDGLAEAGFALKGI